MSFHFHDNSYNPLLTSMRKYWLWSRGGVTVSWNEYVDLPEGGKTVGRSAIIRSDGKLMYEAFEEDNTYGDGEATAMTVCHDGPLGKVCYVHGDVLYQGCRTETYPPPKSEGVFNAEKECAGCTRVSELIAFAKWRCNRQE